MKGLKKSLMLASLLSTLLFPKILRAQVDGEIHNAHDGTSSVNTAYQVIINDGSSGTRSGNCDILGHWSADNFLWPPEIGDTVKMSASKIVGPKTYTTHMRDTLQVAGSPHNGILPTAFLDDPDKSVKANSFGIWYVTDTSNANDTLKAEGWLKKNPNQKTIFYNYFWENGNYVDTSDIYPQVYLNLEKQDSLWTPEDSAVVRLWKTIGDTTWESNITFALDTLKYDGGTMLEKIIFPEEVIVDDTIPPGKPTTLLANGLNPSPWTNNLNFTISWTNPPDSDLEKALYKKGVPANDWDTTGTWNPVSPQSVSITSEGVNPFYLWLADSSGNASKDSSAVVNLRYDATVPSVDNATKWTDTIQQSKFNIETDIYDANGVKNANLYWRVNHEDSVKAEPDSSADNHYWFTALPNDSASPHDSVFYKFIASDSSGNTAYWPGPSENKWHGFEIKETGAEEPIKPKKREVKIGPNPFYSSVNISWPVEKAELNIYDVSGRLIDKVNVDNYKAEWGKDASKGVYFAKPKPGELNGKIEVKNGVWKLIKL